MHEYHSHLLGMITRFGNIYRVLVYHVKRATLTFIISYQILFLGDVKLAVFSTITVAVFSRITERLRS